MVTLKGDKQYNCSSFQYDLTYLVVIWERDDIGMDAKNHTRMNFAMCPSVCMGAVRGHLVLTLVLTLTLTFLTPYSVSSYWLGN